MTKKKATKKREVFDPYPNTLSNPPTVVETTKLDMAFPAQVIGRLLPRLENIPDELKHGISEWPKWANHLFHKGGADIAMYPREGVDAEKAYLHAMCCLRSYEPKHEHKIAGVAYLLATFFEKIEVTKGDASGKENVQSPPA